MKSNSKYKKIIIGIVLITVAFFILKIYDIFFNPFQTVQERATKRFCDAAAESLKDKLDLMYVSAEDKSLQVVTKLDEFENIESFSASEINFFGTFLSQALSFLNSEVNNITEYSNITICFKTGYGRNPISIRCVINKEQDNYILSEIIVKNACCLLSDLSIIEGVQKITYEYYGTSEINKMESLGKFTSLKELVLISYEDEKTMQETIKEINNIIPNCKVIWQKK